MKKTDDKILIAAMYILARDIQSGDGVANAAIAEAAGRLKELHNALADIAKVHVPKTPPAVCMAKLRAVNVLGLGDTDAI